MPRFPVLRLCPPPVRALAGGAGAGGDAVEHVVEACNVFIVHPSFAATAVYTYTMCGLLSCECNFMGRRFILHRGPVSGFGAS